METSNSRMKEQLTLDPAKPISEQKELTKPGFFRSMLQKFYSTKPESLPGSQALETFKFDNLNFNTNKDKKKLYTIARRYPLIFRSIDIKAAFAIPSIDFEFNNDREKNVVEMFLKNIHPASGRIQLKVMLADWFKDTMAFGTGFFDPQWNKERTMIESLKKIHPIDIDLIRDSSFGEGGKVKLDSNGNPVGWLQKIDDKDFKELTFEQIAYLTFHTFGDEWLGISELEPLYQTTWRLMNIEEGIATAIYRHGFPLYDVTVSGGSDGRPPTEPQLNKAAEEVAGLNYKSEFIHGPNYKVELKESFSMGAAKDYTDPFIDQIASLSGVPRFILLGKAVDVSKSSFPELISTIELALKPSQDKLKLVFEEQILKPLMEANHIDTTPQLIIGRTDLFLNAEKKKLVKEAKEEAIREKFGLELEKLKEDKKEREVKKLEEKKHNKEADKETEIIKENKNKQEAKRKHKFKAAEWTHPNGHPRCLICGDEERIGGICEGLKEDLEDGATTSETIPEVRNKISTKKKEIKKVNGLNLTSPHGTNLLSGEKKQLGFSVKEEKELKKYIGKETFIFENGIQIGKIKLREPRKIDLNEFIDLEYAHMIEGDERKARWPDETNFLVYEFDIIKEKEEK